MIPAGLPEDFGRISRDRRACGDVSRDDAAGSDQSVFPDGDPAQQGRTRADGCATLHVRLLTFPVGITLGSPGSGGRARAAIVNENYTMPNEDFGFDRDTFANESVTRNFATLTDFGALLDFDKGANPRFIADLTAVKIDATVNADVAPEPDIRRDQLLSGSRFAH